MLIWGCSMQVEIFSLIANEKQISIDLVAVCDSFSSLRWDVEYYECGCFDKLEKANQDDTLTFEQLGIDRLFIDEAHEFKNLFVATKLQNVAGISNSASQKALDLFLKCRYLDEKTGGKGVIFATGTPYASPYQH